MIPIKNQIWLIFNSPELIKFKPDQFTVKFTDLAKTTEWDYLEAFGGGSIYTYTFYTDVFVI